MRASFAVRSLAPFTGRGKGEGRHAAGSLGLRVLLIVGGVLAALILLGTVGTVLAFPFGAAAACPACYGFERLPGNIFIERAAPPEQRAQVAAVLEQARQRVAIFYGSTDTQPRILVCVNEDCYRRIRSAGSRSNALLDVALQLSPRGIDPVIAAHELSHIELHHRIGRIRHLMGVIPSWFDEGVAVVVSDDRRYLAPADAADRCVVRSDEMLPTGLFEWRRELRRHDNGQLYAKAACRVTDWMAKRDGAAAVMRLIASVAGGMSFAEAYAAER